MSASNPFVPSANAERMRKRVRMCLRKLRFDSLDAARRYALARKPIQRAYECPYCRRFHLTSKS